MYIAYAPLPPLSRPRQILFLGDAPLSRPTEKDTSTKRGCPLFFGGFSAPAHGLCGNVGRLPSQSRLPPCQLPQRGSQVCAPPKACAKPSLASPFGGRWCPVGTVQRLVSAAASVGDGRSPLGCITRAGRRECPRRGRRGRGASAPRYQSLCCNPSKYLLS